MASRKLSVVSSSLFAASGRPLPRSFAACTASSSRILCILGPMDYFLYDRIEKAVAHYRAETGDSKTFAFKLRGVNLITEGFGAVSHPSAKTHLRMGLELADRIRNLTGTGGY